MLFIIDMQNDYIDREKGKKYVRDSEKIVKGIINKIKDCEKKGEYIYYTSDIFIEKNKGNCGKNHKILDNLNIKENIEIQEKRLNYEDRWGCKLYGDLKPYLEDHKRIKKSYYAIPTKSLVKFQEKFKEEKHIIEAIEFVGVETHICVLANAICIQSTFPEANIIIDASLCKSKDDKDHEYALKVMEGLGMEVRR